MEPTRVIFMGSPEFAVPVLEALLGRPASFAVVGVVTQPDKPAGRGRLLTPPPVKLAAIAAGLPVLQPTKMKIDATRDSLAALRPDVVVVAAYGRILPPALLAIPSAGCVNVHASLLPRHRGASPIHHAILAGDPEVGVAIMRMEAGLDTGPVYAMHAVPMPARASAVSLSPLLAALGAELLLAVLPDIVAGTLTPTPQDERAATYAPLLAKEDGRLDFGEPAAALERRVRAMTPWPGAFAVVGGRRLLVTEAEVVDGGRGEVGVVQVADKHGVVVACRDGGLRLLTVQPEGRKLMPAGAWVAGRGVQVGERLGS
ncbi:MAG: methionyl-tRNA formyltransferase [Deltaproteobacteria bacterium]|nr:methionyl-tRNA formyltransferase [Deltaproteobacteria bacterium]